MGAWWRVHGAEAPASSFGLLTSFGLPSWRSLVGDVSSTANGAEGASMSASHALSRARPQRAPAASASAATDVPRLGQTRRRAKMKSRCSV